MGEDQTRKCPFCAETIKAEAIKCRFCGSSVTPETPGLYKPPPSPVIQAGPTPSSPTININQVKAASRQINDKGGLVPLGCLGLFLIIVWFSISAAAPTVMTVINLLLMAFFFAVGIYKPFNQAVAAKVKREMTPWKYTIVGCLFIFFSITSLSAAWTSGEQARMEEAALDEAKMDAEADAKALEEFNAVVAEADQLMKTSKFREAAVKYGEALKMLKVKTDFGPVRKKEQIARLASGEEAVVNKYLDGQLVESTDAELASFDPGTLPAKLSTGYASVDAALVSPYGAALGRERARRLNEQKEKLATNVERLKGVWSKIKQLEKDGQVQKALQEFGQLRKDRQELLDAQALGIELDGETKSILSAAEAREKSLTAKWEKQKAEEKRLESLRGPAPVNSGWDGSVLCVKNYLNENLKDPDSVEYIEWSPVVPAGNFWGVRCKYRAKNSFGGFVVEQKIFLIQHNQVVASQ